ncbi:hypothetical protein MTO96_012806 [Rhipicephalus appendiculatus]
MCRPTRIGFTAQIVAGSPKRPEANRLLFPGSAPAETRPAIFFAVSREADCTADRQRAHLPKKDQCRASVPLPPWQRKRTTEAQQKRIVTQA